MRPGAVTAVLIPIKGFRSAKVRLSQALDADERAALARSMAEGVLRAADGLPAWVVCDDQEVAEWARARRASVFWTPGLGLNQAVGEGVRRLASSGFDLVTVAHADLPLVVSLTNIAVPGTVVLAPDRRGDGTNVAAVPTGVGFTFSYGPNSFSRHQEEARRLGIPCEVLNRPDLAWDVDVPDDLGPVMPVRP